MESANRTCCSSSHTSRRFHDLDWRLASSFATLLVVSWFAREQLHRGRTGGYHSLTRLTEGQIQSGSHGMILSPASKPRSSGSTALKPKKENRRRREFHDLSYLLDRK